MIPRTERKQLRAVIYTRVSTEEQARRRISLRMQASRCRAYAKQLGWKVVKAVSDPGYSGKDLRRPGIDAIRELIKDGQVDVLIVYRLDRLSRTLRHMLNFVDEDLAAEGVNFVSTSERFDTTSAAGRLLFEILGTLAEFERTLISERTRDSLASKRERQEYTGGSPPYGLRLSSKKPLQMAPRKREQDAIAIMLRLRSKGVSFQNITDHLNAEGIRPRRAKQWSKNTVRKIVQREERRRQSLAG